MNPSLSLEGIVIVRRNDISIAKRTNAKNLRLRYGSKVFQTELPTSVKASDRRCFDCRKAHVRNHNLPIQHHRKVLPCWHDRQTDGTKDL